jgi:nitroreductase
MTTRSVRRRLDLRRAVDRQILQQCIDVAIQAPNGGNLGRYRFVVVTDTAKRARIGELYRKAFTEFVPGGTYGPGLVASTAYLAEHRHEVPVHVIPCVEGRAEDRGVFWQATRYGSILPAAYCPAVSFVPRTTRRSWCAARRRFSGMTCTPSPWARSRDSN